MPEDVQRHAGRTISFERERGVYDVRVTSGLAHVVAGVGTDDDRIHRMQRVFQALAKHEIPIFLIKLHRSAVTFAVNEDLVSSVEQSLQGVALACRARKNLALITVIASSMRDLTGVMVSIADSLQSSKTKLFGSGDSHNSVQCLIDGDHVDASVKQLYETFGLGEID